MPWQQRSRRRAELPKDWPTIRLAVLERDGYRCRIPGPRCTGTATHVDHIDPAGPHEPWNLRAACRTDHMARTAGQSHAARPTRQRPTGSHPGLTLGHPTPPPQYDQDRSV